MPPSIEPIVLLVPGFLTEIYAAIGKDAEAQINSAIKRGVERVPGIGKRLAQRLEPIELPIAPGGLQTFYAQKAHYEAERIEHFDVSDHPGFNSQQSVASNGEAIASWLESVGDRRVTIVSHSKGGLDTLQALLSRRELRRKVSGWVAFEAPFHGSQIADVVPHGLMDKLLSAFGGSSQALDDLRTENRTAYMKQHTERIGELTQSIPVRSCFGQYRASPMRALPNLVKSVVAELMRSRSGEKSINTRANDLIRAALGDIGLMDTTNALISGPNDGLVPVESTRLPGAERIELSPPADHSAPTMSVAPYRDFWSDAQRVAETDRHVNELSAG